MHTSDIRVSIIQLVKTHKQETMYQIPPLAATILASWVASEQVPRIAHEMCNRKNIAVPQHRASTHRKENFPDTAEAAVSRMRELGIRSAREREVEVSQQERAEMEMERAQLSSWQVRTAWNSLSKDHQSISTNGSTSWLTVNDSAQF